MYPEYYSRKNSPVQIHAQQQDGAFVVFSTLAIFATLIGLLGYSPWAVLFLPTLAYLIAILSSKSDHFGLSLCVLITISLSYYFSIGQIPGLVTVIRLAIIGLLLVGFAKSGSIPGEYKFALGLLAFFFASSAVSSYFNSFYVSISELKLLFGAFFFFGLLLSTRATDRFPAIAFGVVSAIILLSLMFFLVYPAIGYAYFADANAAESAMGRYSGIMNHPQLLACLVAVNLPLILHTYLVRSGALSSLALGVLIGAGVLIAISSSRTGLLAVSVALISTLIMARGSLDPQVSRRVNVIWVVIFIALVFGLATSFEQIQLFIYKTDDLEDGIRLSGRDEIIKDSWQGFMANPIFGNGFQVPSDFTEHGGATFGISSDVTSVEKCFFITMLLEEVGLVGTILFLGFILSMLMTWRRKGAYVAVSALLTFLTINLGEACILSPSSIGGLCWLSIFAVHNLTLDQGVPEYENDPDRRGLC
jgi:hypothetical protein